MIAHYARTTLQTTIILVGREGKWALGCATPIAWDGRIAGMPEPHFLHSNSGLNAEQGRPGLLAQSHSILPKAMITNHNTTVSVPGHEKSHHNLPRPFMVESPR